MAHITSYCQRWRAEDVCKVPKPILTVGKNASFTLTHCVVAEKKQKQQQKKLPLISELLV